MSRERLTEAVHVGLVDDGRSRVYPFRQRVGRRGPPVFKLVNCVVVKIVNEFQAVIAHLVRLLLNRRGDNAAVDPVKRSRVFVEGDDRNIPLKIEAMQKFGSARTAGTVLTTHALDYHLL